MASIPPHIPILDAAPTLTWRPFLRKSPIWTPHQLSHGVHSTSHLKSGRRPVQHMASIPPHIPNLDATITSTWRPFLPPSPIWTPLTPAHGVHSAPHLKSGRRPLQHMASIPPQISNLDATPTLTWRPFLRKSPIWTPHQLSHGVHSAQHPQSGRHTNSHMASIPPNIHNLDATPTLTWRPFLHTSQIWTPHRRHPHQHTASIPLNIHNLDAAHSSTWRPFRPTSTIWTPHRRRTDAARQGSVHFPKNPFIRH